MGPRSSNFFKFGFGGDALSSHSRHLSALMPLTSMYPSKVMGSGSSAILKNLEPEKMPSLTILDTYSLHAPNQYPSKVMVTGVAAP